MTTDSRRKEDGQIPSRGLYDMERQGRRHAQEGEKAHTGTAGQRTVSPQEDHKLPAAGARIPLD